MKFTIFVLSFMLAGTLARHGTHGDLYKRSSGSQDGDFAALVTAAADNVKSQFADTVAQVESLILDIHSIVLGILQKLLEIPGISGLMNTVPFLPEIINGTLPITALPDLFTLDNLDILLNQILPINDLLNIIPQLSPLVDLALSAVRVPLSLLDSIISVISSTISTLLSIIIPIP